MAEQYPHFIKDKPIGEDQFSGNSHQRIADTIAAPFLNEDKGSDFQVPKFIGLEGPWGSGKSNIIEIIKSRLADKCHVYVYDAWGHQEDIQRRAFLEELTENLIEKKILSNNENINWEEKKRNLLSRKKETTTKTMPKLSIGILLSFFVVLLTPIFKTIAEKVVDIKNNPILFILVSLLPFLVFSLIWTKKYLCSRFIEKEPIRFYDFLSLYRNKELEQTTNEIYSDLEPSVRDFKEWMKAISETLNKKLIVVIDNIDRLPPDKVKDIWSSIHTFFSEENIESVFCIIPFDKEHLKEAFDCVIERKENTEENNQQVIIDNTQEFINKSFGVVYRVTPPVLTDWKGFFNSKMNEAFAGTINEEEKRIVLTIFDRLKPQFTPRDIILFVNELVSLKQIWKDEIPLKYIALFCLTKERISMDPVRNILEVSFVHNVESLFQKKDDLQKFITCLTYNVDGKYASQVLIQRDIENNFRGIESRDINDLTKHSEFFDMLEQVIKERNDFTFYPITMERSVNTLGKLNTNTFTSAEHNRINCIWDELVVEQCKNNFNVFHYHDYYDVLFANCSAISKHKFANWLINRYNQCTEIKGKEYFEVLDHFQEVIEKHNVDFDISENIKTRTVPINVFLKYFEIAQVKYKKFKIECHAEDLDKYFEQLLKEGNEHVLEKLELELLANDKKYCFDNSLNKLKSLFSEGNIHTRSSLPYLYYLLSKSSSVYFTNLSDLNLLDTNTVNKMYNLTENEKAKRVLISIYISFGKYNGLSPTKETNEVLTKPSDVVINEVLDIIEDFMNFDDLLILSKCGFKLIKELGIRLINDISLKKHKFIVKSLFDNYKDIKSNLQISAERLLNKYSSIFDRNNYEEIDLEPIKYIEFYEDILETKNNLTDYIKSKCIDYINSLEVEDIENDWNNEEPHSFKLVKLFYENKAINELPNNFSKAFKAILDDIYRKKLSIPEMNTVQYQLIMEADKSISATIKDIRDEYINTGEITPDQFLFFSKYFRNFGALQDRPGDFIRRILANVINNDECLADVLEHSGFYSDIVKKAKDDANNFKEAIVELIEEKPVNSELINFANLMNINLDENIAEVDA